MKRLIKSFFIISILSLTFLFSASADSPAQVVRVAQPDIDNFFITDFDGNLSGYGAEYLDKIAEYTGWQFEMVPGTWSECLQRLEKGEVDLVFPVEYSAERGEKYSYSDVQCSINYIALLCRGDNNAYYFNDYKSFDGMTIGMVEDNFLNLGFELFAARQNFSYTPVYYPNTQSMDAALAARRVDAVVNGNFSTAQNQKLLAQFDYMPSYFVSTKDKQNLISQLDTALYQIGLECPDFLTRLGDKYYSNVLRQAQTVSREEAEFIAACPPLKVVCDPDNYPFEWFNEKTGRFEGVDIDLLTLIAAKSGLTFEYVRCDSMAQAWETIGRGEADLIAGAYGSESLSKKYGLVFTDSYTNETSVFVARNLTVFTASNPLTLAARTSQIGMRTYLSEKYTNWNILSADDSANCLDLVRQGQADAAFISALSLQTTPLLNDYPDLSIVSTLSESVPVRLGVRVELNDLLLTILNKSILQITSSDIEQATVKNSVAKTQPASWDSLFRNSPGIFTGIILAVFLIFFFIVFIIYRNHTQAQQAKLLTEKNNQLQEAIALVQHAERAREQYDQLYNTAVCGILQVACRPEDGSLRIINLNKEAARLTGLLPEYPPDILRKKLHRLLGEATRASLWTIARALEQPGDKYPLEIHLTHSDDLGSWISGTAELIHLHDNEKVLQFTFMDTTYRKQQEEKLKQRSQVDFLTGLWNKATAEHMFAEYLSKPSPMCAFFVIDIDNFKSINDTCGHQGGDDVLQKVGDCLSAQFRSGDIVGRIGGDEFAALLRDASEEGGVCRRAQRVCDAVSALSQDIALPVSVSCSIGIACCPTHATSYQALFEAADKALYHVKRNGKGGWALYSDSLL